MSNLETINKKYINSTQNQNKNNNSFISKSHDKFIASFIGAIINFFITSF